MSRANVELVKRIYEAFAAGGAEAIVPYFPSDVVFIAFPEWLEQSEFPGHDGVRAITAVWTESFDDFGFEVSDIRETGDGVVMLGETVGQIKDSGVPIRQPLGWSTRLPRRWRRPRLQLPDLAGGARAAGLEP